MRNPPAHFLPFVGEIFSQNPEHGNGIVDSVNLNSECVD